MMARRSRAGAGGATSGGVAPTVKGPGYGQTMPGHNVDGGFRPVLQVGPDLSEVTQPGLGQADRGDAEEAVALDGPEMRGEIRLACAAVGVEDPARAGVGRGLRDPLEHARDAIERREVARD